MAYLLGLVDLRVNPPTIVSVGVFTDDQPTRTSGFAWVIIAQDRSLSPFHESHDYLISLLDVPGFRWAKPLLDKPVA